MNILKLVDGTTNDQHLFRVGGSDEVLSRGHHGD